MFSECKGKERGGGKNKGGENNSCKWKYIRVCRLNALLNAAQMSTARSQGPCSHLPPRQGSESTPSQGALSERNSNRGIEKHSAFRPLVRNGHSTHKKGIVGGRDLDLVEVFYLFPSKVIDLS